MLIYKNDYNSMSKIIHTIKKILDWLDDHASLIAIIVELILWISDK